MGEYFLVVTILLLISAIIYVWYVSIPYRYISDDDPLILNTEEDRLVSNWYAQNIKHNINFDIDDIDTAHKLLQRLVNKDIDRNDIVIGFDLNSKYYNLTRKTLKEVYDLRSMIGKPGEIAIIDDPKIRSRLQNHDIDFSEIKQIIDSDLDIIAYEYFQKVLKYRWDKLLELQDNNLINSSGSYAYIKHDVQSSDDNIVLFDNVIAYNFKPGVARINLLCKDIEFETLLTRWQKSKETLLLS